MREKGLASPHIPLLLDAGKCNLVYEKESTEAKVIATPVQVGLLSRDLDQQKLGLVWQVFPTAGGRLSRVANGTTMAGITTAAVRAMICPVVR